MRPKQTFMMIHGYTLIYREGIRYAPTTLGVFFRGRPLFLFVTPGVSSDFVCLSLDFGWSGDLWGARRWDSSSCRKLSPSITCFRTSSPLSGVMFISRGRIGASFRFRTASLGRSASGVIELSCFVFMDGFSPVLYPALARTRFSGFVGSVD